MASIIILDCLKMWIYLPYMLIIMSKRIINRLKAVLAEKGKTNKWLAEELNKNETTISRWCTNEVQPSLLMLYKVAEVLKIDTQELLVKNKNK